MESLLAKSHCLPSLPVTKRTKRQNRVYYMILFMLRKTTDIFASAKQKKKKKIWILGNETAGGVS